MIFFFARAEIACATPRRHLVVRREPRRYVVLDFAGNAAISPVLGHCAIRGRK